MAAWSRTTLMIARFQRNIHISIGSTFAGLFEGMYFCMRCSSFFMITGCYDLIIFDNDSTNAWIG